jgi:hypothetical protein
MFPMRDPSVSVRAQRKLTDGLDNWPQLRTGFADIAARAR